MMNINIVLDWFFMILHPALILFNLFGWIWDKTRKANFILLLLTGGSWFILGLWKGIGYCPFTDWHYEVLQKLGTENIPYSYVKYLADRITGWNIPANLIDTLTISFYFLALICSLAVNFRNRKKTKS